MKKKILLYSLWSLLLLLTSCKDFLEEYSQNQVYATSAEDLDELLAGECFMPWVGYINMYSQVTMSSVESYNYPWLHVMDDDSEEFLLGELAVSQASPRNVFAPFHRWYRDPFTTIENKQWEDKDWARFYERIAVLNNIIYYANEFRSKEENVELLDRVEGEGQAEDMFDHIALKELIHNLDKREQKIVMLSFYFDKTQSEIAKELKISQVQVSRLENKILENLRKKLI